ncbi:MAG: response regulator transcription factor [Verrucomicrobia bacterium]|nr:response regulator transcription factor [Verrucomicrobiota bacterium]
MTLKKDSPSRVAKRRIVIVDDHPLLRRGVAGLINREHDLHVCGEAQSAAEALQVIRSLRPDIALVDISLGGRSGLELIKDLQIQHEELPVLVLSMHDESLYAERVLRAGARGYITKQSGGKALLKAIREVLNGRVFLSDSMSTKLLQNLAGRRPGNAASPLETLTDREFEVFQLIGEGRSSRRIADTLHVSIKTVEAHRANIKAKLKLKEGTDLVHYAVRWVETRP